VTDLADWLADLGLDKYAAAFARQEIDFDLLPLLSDADLRELGLPIGPRRKLLAAIAALRGEVAARSEKEDRRNEAERRQLTVMFVDLAQSTALALRLDPETLRDVLRAFRDAVTAEIGRFGYVAKLMGDGVLAYFGWPRAHEDDARRAVTTALAIAGAVARLETPTGDKLACRIGIATGIVVVGDLIGEGAATERAVVGPTPNLAARLQEVAGPGEVMIADATRRLVGSDFLIEAIGERLLKGHDRPVPLFRVLGPGVGGTRFPTHAAGESAPIVGRAAELATLRDAWRETRSGCGRAVLVSGEAGIGKSRLVQALVEHVAADTPVLRLFTCSPLHRENPFWPVAQALPAAASIVRRSGEAAERRQGPHDLVRALTVEVLGSEKPRPALLVFEDVQWADRATIELLRQLLRVVANTPALLIMTSRPEAAPRLGPTPTLVRLALGRLENDAATMVLAEAAGRHAVPGRLVNEILLRSDGIPLFIEEMTKAVIEAEPAGNPVSVPATLRDSLMARLDALPRMKAAAQIASCIGREFAERLLRKVSDIPSAELEEGLDALVDGGLLIASGAGTFRFKHALVCDIAHESLLTPRRKSLHRRIATALEAGPDNLVADEPELLAHHWFAAGESGRAERFWLRARHRLAHWQEQLDALADYLEADGGEVIPFPGAPTVSRPY
jgi:class 3 adenylate cyclase